LSVMTKVCTKCKEEKPKTEFYTKPGSKDGLYSWCKPCATQINMERYYKDPRASKDRALRRNYGITIEQWDILFEQQGGRCAICYTFEPGYKNTFVVDHDHDTGVVRGLLCNNCNRSLGLLKDSTTVLKSAVSYLERFKCE
jgi:hypothetical protein